MARMRKRARFVGIIIPLSAFIMLIAIVVLVCGRKRLVTEYESRIDSIYQIYKDSGSKYTEVRTIEQDIMTSMADITSRQNQVEQNIDLAYSIIQEKAKKSGNEAMMKILEERIATIKETMTPGDLVQAIAVLKENFPNGSYEELDLIIEHNTKIIDRIVKLKELYNYSCSQYEAMCRDYKDSLDLINYVPMVLKRYEIDAFD